MAGDIRLDREVLPATVFNVSQAVTTAASKYKRPIGQLVMEVAKALFGPGRVQPEEFFRMRMFAARLEGENGPGTFSGRSVAFQHNLKVNDLKLWWELSDDKVLTTMLLEQSGLPCPPISALYHPSDDFGRRIPTLRDAEALAAFLREPSHFPLFIKPMDLAWSLGTASLTTSDGSSVTDPFGRTAPIDAFAREVAELGETGMVIQPTMANHPDLAAVCGPALATVRFLVTNADGTPRIERTHIKMPAGQNVADNTWRKGNVAAAVEPETGTIKKGWVGAGFDANASKTHPDTNKSLAITLPDWDAARELVL